jgi:hypothetical protein
MDIGIKFDEPITDELILAYAIEYKPDLTSDLEIVLKTAFGDIRNLPTLGYSVAKTKNSEVPLKLYISKFIDKYIKGYENRPTIRIGNSSKTHSDPIVGLIFSLRVADTSEAELKKIIEGHSLQMSIENIVGDLLEEYLSIRLCNYGWVCCWGSSIDAVDFCNSKGELLQVKNSDNSENSSSSRVRNGTEIKKWSRRKSTKNNTFYWDKLIEFTGADNISEEDFRGFIISTIENNPKCIYVNDEPIVF